MNHIYLSAKNTMPLRDPQAAGLWIRTQRRMMKMTQVDLARKAQVTQRLISEVENGKVGIRLETFFRIAEALQLQVATVDLKVPMQADSELEW